LKVQMRASGGGAVDGDFGQGVIDRREADEGEGVGPGARVLGVGSAATGQPKAQDAARFWCGLFGEGAERQAHGKRTGHGSRGSAVLQEVPTWEAEFMVRLSNLVFVIAHCIAPDQKLMEFQFKTTQDTGPGPGAYNV
jgi:hypothetical protein